MKRISSRALNLAVGASFVLATAGAVRAADAPDAWVTTKASVAVLSAVGTSATDIRIETVDGLVTLHGTVTTAEDKSAAEAAAKKVKGTKKVRNLIEVVRPKDEKVVTAVDSAIETQVAEALKSDTVLKDETGIAVKSVHKGTVLLSGKATTLENHLRAIEDARGVAGVKRVSSTIDSPDSTAIRKLSMPAAASKQ